MIGFIANLRWKLNCLDFDLLANVTRYLTFENLANPPTRKPEATQDGDFLFSADTQLKSIKKILNSVAEPLGLNASVQLWNGDTIPLGQEADGPLHDQNCPTPGVVGSLMRKPTLENIGAFCTRLGRSNSWAAT